MSNVSFPYSLKPGGSFYFQEEKAPLIETLRKAHPGKDSVELRAVIFDAISRPFYSDWRRHKRTAKNKPAAERGSHH